MSNLPARILVALLVWASTLPGSPGYGREPAAAGSPFRLSVTRDENLALRLRWTIAAGTYLYRDRIGASGASGQWLPIDTQPGETKDDPNFGPVEVYHDSAEATVPGTALAGVREVRVTYQGCAEQGICYPPAAKLVDVATLAQRDADGKAASPDVAVEGGATSAPPATRTDAPPGTAASLLAGNPFGVFAGLFGLGLLLAFTPCVLPMVPILSGMLVRSGERLTAWRGLTLSGAYVLAMAAAYAFLGIAAAWSGRNLQVALQTPLALGAMSAVLVALALSMFGLFEVQAPRWWRNRTAGSAGRGGSILGAALLGFSSALVVGPCVTPPLAAALLYVAQTGDVPRGALALFALGLGMGTPLVVVGTFGARVLPRSGPWLVRSKQAFGFVFLAVAVSLLSRLLPPGAALMLWGGLTIGFGLSLAAAVGPGAWALAGRTAGVMAVAYGGALVVGAASGGNDPLRPLAFLGHAQPPAPEARTVGSLPAFEEALRAARVEAKPILVEFVAGWCTVCKDNDRTVLSDPAIRKRLRSVSVIRADVTHDDGDSRALMRRFEVVGPPTLILLGADGAEIPGARTEGALTVEGLERRLALAGV